MEARDILTATHELEETGMTRSQSETIANTIIAAVAPLATTEDLEAAKADIESIKERMATKEDLEAVKADIVSIKERMATKEDLEAVKADIVSIKEKMATKEDIAALREDNKANLESLKEHLATKKEVESVKNSFLTGLLVLYGILLAAVLGIVFA